MKSEVSALSTPIASHGSVRRAGRDRRAVHGVVDTNLIEGKPELGARIDRAKAADLGVNVRDVATTLNVIIGGQTLALVLTLVGTPVAYSIFDDWSTKKPLRTFLGLMMGRRPA